MTHARSYGPPLLATVLVVALSLSLLAPAASRGDDTQADDAPSAPGRIGFLAKTPLLDARGEFRHWRFTEVDIDPADPQGSSVAVEVDVASVDTGIGRRDAHLRRDDFFDTEKFPTATVRVQDVAADGQDESGEDRYRATFVLTIRGIEKAVPGHFVVTSLAPPTVRGELTIDRMDFGINKPKSRWNPMSIDEEIPITFDAVVPADPETGASLLGS